MTAAGYFRVQAPFYVGVVLVMAIACASLVPAYGLAGAAYAMVAAALFQLAGSAAIVLHAVHRGTRRENRGVPEPTPEGNEIDALC